MFNLKTFIENYQTFDACEVADKEAFKFYLGHFGDNIWTRENLTGHVTVAAWVVNPQCTKVLMGYHLQYDAWSWLGGHADGERDLLQMALREVREESGVQNLKVISPLPISIDVINVRGHIKKGRKVAGHLHYNLTFLFETEENEKLVAKEDENKGLKWIGFSQVENQCTEKFMIPIYQRVMKKAKKIYEERQSNAE